MHLIFKYPKADNLGVAIAQTNSGFIIFQQELYLVPWIEQRPYTNIWFGNFPIYITQVY